MVGAFERAHIMALNIVYCPRCNSDHVYRHGKSIAGHVCYRCPACLHVFQISYTYEAYKPGVKEKIIQMVSTVIPPVCSKLASIRSSTL